MAAQSIIVSDEERESFAQEIVESRNALVHDGHYNTDGRDAELQWRGLLWLAAAVIAREAGQKFGFEELPERIWHQNTGSR